MRYSLRVLLAAAVFIVVVPCTQAQDDKVFRELTPEATGKLLQELKIEFNKSASPKGDEQYFEFERNGYRIRLTQFSPQELKLDCVFEGISLDNVNVWNKATRFSRVTHHKDGDGQVTLLEYGLDITGGATAGTIRQFVLRFDSELEKYDKFINGDSATVFTPLTDANIENALKSGGIEFQKKANNAGVVMFDFQMNGHNLRLYNFGGKDLMIDTHYRKVPLDAANGFNLKRKFIRVVNYKGKDVEYTALEANLDCEAGVTERMIRHWVRSFAMDAQTFGVYAKKLQEEKK